MKHTKGPRASDFDRISNYIPRQRGEQMEHRLGFLTDHFIGKRESRFLREEHNKAMNSYEELLGAAKDVLSDLNSLDYHTGESNLHKDWVAKRRSEYIHGIMEQIERAITNAEGGSK